MQEIVSLVEPRGLKPNQQTSRDADKSAKVNGCLKSPRTPLPRACKQSRPPRSAAKSSKKKTGSPMAPTTGVQTSGIDGVVNILEHECSPTPSKDATDDNCSRQDAATAAQTAADARLARALAKDSSQAAKAIGFGRPRTRSSTRVATRAARASETAHAASSDNIDLVNVTSTDSIAASSPPSTVTEGLSPDTCIELLSSDDEDDNFPGSGSPTGAKSQSSTSARSTEPVWKLDTFVSSPFGSGRVAFIPMKKKLPALQHVTKVQLPEQVALYVPNQRPPDGAGHRGRTGPLRRSNQRVKLWSPLTRSTKTVFESDLFDLTGNYFLSDATIDIFFTMLLPARLCAHAETTTDAATVEAESSVKLPEAAPSHNGVEFVDSPAVRAVALCEPTHRQLSTPFQSLQQFNDKVFCFSTFFLQQAEQCLSKRGADSDSDLYRRLKKWLPKFGSLFDRDFLVVPIHNHAHWSACVVCNPGHIFGDSNFRYVEMQKKGVGTRQVLETNPDFLRKRAPCIVFFDSLRVHRSFAVSKWLRPVLELVAVAEGRIPAHLMCSPGSSSSPPPGLSQPKELSAQADMRRSKRKAGSQASAEPMAKRSAPHCNGDHDVHPSEPRSGRAQPKAQHQERPAEEESGSSTEDEIKPSPSSTEGESKPPNEGDRRRSSDDGAQTGSTESQNLGQPGELAAASLGNDANSVKRQQTSSCRVKPNASIAATDAPSAMTRLNTNLKVSVICPTCQHRNEVRRAVGQVSGLYNCANPSCSQRLKAMFRKTFTDDERDAVRKAAAAERARKSRPYHVNAKVLRAFKVATPQQTNSFDCALYMMQYVELFLLLYGRHPDKFTFGEVSQNCRKIGINRKWFDVSDMKTKRSVLRGDLLELQKQHESLQDAGTHGSRRTAPGEE